MISKDELRKLLDDIESDRSERTISVNNKDKFSRAVCAFANDFPDHKQPGYLIIGADDETGAITSIEITDKLLQNLAGIRNNGQVLPQPSLAVQKYSFDEGDVAVVEVYPSTMTPVRYKGRVWVRNGPSKAIANSAEENILTEKRTANGKTFDVRPCEGSSLGDLDFEFFTKTYLPSNVDSDVIENDDRSVEEQMASLRIIDKVYQIPTNGGILICGKDPKSLLPGAYVQYVRYSGTTMAAPIENEEEFSGNIVNVLNRLDTFIRYMNESKPIKVSALKEQIVQKYPENALRELINNAVMHRSYDNNAPIRFYEFKDRIEISNPGGLYGIARPENFPDQNDYRNPILAEGMKTLGYVNKFNRGIRRAQNELESNGNPLPIFEYKMPLQFKVTIPCSHHFNIRGKNTEITRGETNISTREEMSYNIDNQVDIINIITREENEGTTREETKSTTREESKTPNVILRLMKEDPTITMKALAEKIKLTEKGVEYHIKKLREEGKIRRKGSTKSGRWVVTSRAGL